MAVIYNSGLKSFIINSSHNPDLKVGVIESKSIAGLPAGQAG